MTERLEAVADARGGVNVEPKVFFKIPHAPHPIPPNDVFKAGSGESLSLIVTAYDDITNGTFRYFITTITIEL